MQRRRAGGQVPEQLTDADQSDEQRSQYRPSPPAIAPTVRSVGNIAPWPIEISIVGPYAGTMSCRHGTTPEVGGSRFGPIRRTYRASRMGPELVSVASRRRPSSVGLVASPALSRAPAPVAQRIEQQPSNLSVVGSSPTRGARHRLLGKGLTPLSTYSPIPPS